MNLRTSFFAAATTLTLSAGAYALPGGDPLSGKFSIEEAIAQPRRSGRADGSDRHHDGHFDL